MTALNIYQECGELRKVIRDLQRALQELLWLAYGADLTEDDLAVIEDAKRLLARCKEIVG